MDQDTRAARERVGVHLQRVDAVLEDVLGRDGVVRQLARLARRDEAGAELARERAAEDEAARLGGDDEVDAARARPLAPGRATAASSAAGSSSSGVMSLKTMPGFG